MVYPSVLPLMSTPRLPVVDWTDYLNGLVRFAEGRNLVSARVPSYFNWPLPLCRERVKLFIPWHVPTSLGLQQRYSYSLRTALFCDIKQRVVATAYRRFGTTYRSHFQGSRPPKNPLNMESIRCPETSVRNYHYLLRNNPEEHSSHLLRGGSLKSRSVSISALWSRHFCDAV